MKHNLHNFVSHATLPTMNSDYKERATKASEEIEAILQKYQVAFFPSISMQDMKAAAIDTPPIAEILKP